MKNKYISVTIVAAFMVLLATFVPGALADNGAPKGGHDWNLNIIGVQNAKYWDFDGETAHDNGHRLFVALNKDGTKVTTRIHLVMGDTFQVIDPDGTDGHATLQLMDPYELGTNFDPDAVDPSATAAYRIYIRALGKPGGKAVITTGFTDEYDVDWLSLENVTIERKKGKSVFTDRTLDLTTIYVDITDDGVYNPIRYPIFGNEDWSYFWNYDNSGMKLIQMRFYLTD